MVGRKKTKNEGQYFGEFTPENMPYVPKRKKKRWYKGYTFIVLTSFLVFSAVGVGIGILWGECAISIFTAVILTAFFVGGSAYEIGRGRAGKKVREAKEDARSMIASRSTYTPADEESEMLIIFDGKVYSEDRFWEVLKILEQEAKRNRYEAEEEEGLVRELYNLRG